MKYEQTAPRAALRIGRTRGARFPIGKGAVLQECHVGDRTLLCLS
jgi:hypothetical protein